MKYITLLLGLFIYSNGQAALSFSVQPNTLISDETVYHKMAQSLSLAVGEEVEYVKARSLNVFSKELLRNKYDIVLMEPHIAAWFLKSGDNGGTEHDLLLASAASLRYEVITPDSKPYQGITDLNGKSVCAPLSPSLATVAFMSEVSNPVNPPIAFNIKSNQHALQSLQKKRCEAIVIESRDHSFWRESSIPFKTIYTSQSFPSWVMTIYAIHPPQVKDALRNFLDSPALANSAIAEFYQVIEQSPKASFMQNPSDDDYLPYNILPGVVWGW